jgi:hypothetical protein
MYVVVQTCSITLSSVGYVQVQVDLVHSSCHIDRSSQPQSLRLCGCSDLFHHIVKCWLQVDLVHSSCHIDRSSQPQSLRLCGCSDLFHHIVKCWLQVDLVHSSCHIDRSSQPQSLRLVVTSVIEDVSSVRLYFHLLLVR